MGPWPRTFCTATKGSQRIGSASTTTAPSGCGQAVLSVTPPGRAGSRAREHPGAVRGKAASPRATANLQCRRLLAGRESRPQQQRKTSVPRPATTLPPSSPGTEEVKTPRGQAGASRDGRAAAGCGHEAFWETRRDLRGENPVSPAIPKEGVGRVSGLENERREATPGLPGKGPLGISAAQRGPWAFPPPNPSSRNTWDRLCNASQRPANPKPGWSRQHGSRAGLASAASVCSCLLSLL
ncbi:uncharacterized protein ACIBXB_005526 isoform 7-T7 [Morphnus guianensis]